MAAAGIDWTAELGRFHVVLVHFPIALLLVAAAVEMWHVLRRKNLSLTAGICLVLGALAAGLSSWSGWVHAVSFARRSSTLETHLILGFATAIACAVTLLFLLLAWFRPGKLTTTYRIGLAMCALLVGAAGHFGGTLTHGQGYLTELLFRSAPPSVAAAPGAVQRISFPSDGRIDFARDVRPIFAQSCYECHTATKHKGELRLDSKLKALQGGNSGKAILAGNPDQSLIIQHVLGINGKKRMPMNGAPLPDEQVRILRAWIQRGAIWPDALKDDIVTEKTHWAYIKPVRHDPPAVQNASWVRNPIDNFILARLEAEGLSPSPEADRVTLIRRLSLDLIGLPPTPDEVDAFVADTSSDAYEKLVNRLLASPHYGERWGRHWLDIARYADTNGYEKDNPRTIWPYRDWVIDAFNRDITFDQFIIQQIAGDMLPNASVQDRIATGFHRNTMFNEEGGIDVEEFRFKAIVDRVQTTSTALLGLTMHCAQCHDHKYDAIKQKEYYQFFALLNNADEPEMEIPSPDIAARRGEITKNIEKIESEYEKHFPADEPRFETVVLKPTTQKADSGATFSLKDDNSLLVRGASVDKDTYTVQATGDASGTVAVKLEVLADPSLPKNGPGRAKNGNFVLTQFKVATTRPDKPVEIASAEADFSQNNFPVSAAIDDKPETGWAIDPGSGIPVRPRTATFTLKEKLPAGTKDLVFTLHQDYEKFPKHTIGRFRLSLLKSVPPPPTTVPAEKRRTELLARKFNEWKDQATAKCSHWTVVEPIKFSRRYDGTITRLPDNSLLFTGDNYYREEYQLDYKVNAKQITGIRLEVLPHDELPKGGPGRNPNGGFVLSEITAVAAPATRPAATQPVIFESATADTSTETVPRAIDGKKDTHWTVGPSNGALRTAVFALKDKLSLDGDAILSLSLLQNYFQSENLGRIRISVTSDPHPVASGVPAEIEGLLTSGRPAATTLPTAEEKKLKQYFLSITPLLSEQHKQGGIL